MSLAIALYEPDIPQNSGTIMRLGACLGLDVHFVGPAAFDTSERSFRRAGLDYLDHVRLMNHITFADFDAWRRSEGRRLVLLSTKAETIYTGFGFAPNDVLLCGRESSGVPETVHAAADFRVRVPLRPHLRSLNVAVSVAIVTGEALRQTGGFPDG
jgi:tRNA (cytidine/uridine-2'-O-)-methyltransferase